MKEFIKTHPHHTVLYTAGSLMVALIITVSALVWTSSNSLYAEQAKQSSNDYVKAVSNGLAGKTSGKQVTKGSTSGTSSGATVATTAPTSTTTTTQAPAASATVASPTLSGLKLYVDPSRASLPAPLGTAAVATWLGGWSGDVQSAANTIVSAATNTGSLATLVAYNIPGRDCGSYSAGGANGSDAYKSWIRSLAAGIGARQAIVILEPDALAQVTCLDSAGQSARYALLSDAVSVLTQQTRARIYIDAGHSNWISAADMAARLQKANVANATGFSLNVSNFETTASNTSYGNAISAKTGGKHFVIDTGRNGNGPGTTWCNPSGRALGESPTTATSGNVDAYLWVKVPGESDGTCGGGPSAGTYWSDYAQTLIANRR